MEQYTLRQYMEKNPDAKLRDIVADMLDDEIVSLRIAPGAKLNVNQLASSLGISRTPVAEAIARVKGLEPEEVARITLDNGKRFFNIIEEV